MPPVVFVHIPKTAGTSFVTTLRNAFGDNRLTRIERVDDNTIPTLENLKSTDSHGISCVAGHLPVSLLREYFERFQMFTLLRQPVLRVMSLFRFIKRQPPAEIERLGLAVGFSLEEMLQSKVPEIYAQVSNGMTRMLCSMHDVVDPNSHSFWETEFDQAILQDAQSNLERIGFGLVEDMPAALKVAQAQWSIPFELQEYSENITHRESSRQELALIGKIASMNRTDLMLYENARKLFYTRSAQLDGGSGQGKVNVTSIFRPVLDREYPLSDVPGRQGFHEFESAGFAWLTAANTAKIHFEVENDIRLRLGFRIYCIVSDYPVADVKIVVNDVHVGHVCLDADDRWVRIISEPFKSIADLNQIRIEMPWCLSVRKIEPQTLDKRRLGIAVASIVMTKEVQGET